MSSNQTDTFTIVPMHVGTCWLGEDHVLGDDYSPDDRMEFALVSFLVRSGGRVVLVDLGPKTLDYANEMFRRYGFFRVLPDGSTPDDLIQPRGNARDNLARLGIRPEDVTDIVFTHLHADHHGLDDAADGGMCEDFPNAVFHVSRIGWDYNVARRTEGRWNSYLDVGFGDCMLRKMRDGKMIAHDNALIAPGLETIYLGGHSICSQAVRIRTQSGDVIIGSDDFYRYDLLANAVIARISTSRQRLVEVSGMLADWALEGAVIVPVHDPVVIDLFDKHAEGWIDQARALSLDAGRGFRQRVPKTQA